MLIFLLDTLHGRHCLSIIFRSYSITEASFLCIYTDLATRWWYDFCSFVAIAFTFDLLIARADCYFCFVNDRRGLGWKTRLTVVHLFIFGSLGIILIF